MKSGTERHPRNFRKLSGYCLPHLGCFLLGTSLSQSATLAIIVVDLKRFYDFFRLSFCGDFWWPFDGLLRLQGSAETDINPKYSGQLYTISSLYYRRKHEALSHKINVETQ